MLLWTDTTLTVPQPAAASLDLSITTRVVVRLNQGAVAPLPQD